MLYGEHHWLIEEHSRFWFWWNAREYGFMTSTSEISQTFCAEYIFELIDKRTWSVTFSGTDGNLSATRGWAFCWRKEIICKRNIASVNWTKSLPKLQIRNKNENSIPIFSTYSALFIRFSWMHVNTIHACALADFGEKLLEIKTHLVRCDAILKSWIQTFFCYCPNYKVWKLIFYPAYIEDNTFYYKNNISEFS